MKTHLIINSALITALVALAFSAGAATVNYTMQTTNFNSSQSSGGGFKGFYNNGASEIGVYANSASDASFAAFQTFTTNGTGSGIARALQPGDTFTLTGFITGNPPSRIGLAFRSSTNYTSFSQIDTANEAKFQLDSSGGWKVYNSGSAIDSGNGAAADATLTIKVTSARTFNATVVRSANTFNTYDVPMITGAGASITSFGVFAVNSANDTFWKNGSLTDSGTVEFGTGNGTSIISGLVADGLAANSTLIIRTNALIKNGSGVITLSNTGNSYSGGTTINGGTLSISSDANLGATSGGVTISGGFNSILSISNSLTLNAGRTITIGSTGGKLDSGTNTLTIAGTLTNTSGNNHLFILANGNTTVSGNATGVGDIVKQGSGTLSLNGSANTFGTATANLYIDNGVVQGASSGAFGQSSSGGGAVTMGADLSANNGASTLLLTTVGASVTNAINTRFYSGFNATKTIGGNNSSGTVTYAGNVTLNDSVNLTSASGGTVSFNGVTATGTANGGQSVNGSPGVVIVGGGTVQLGGANTYSGATIVSNGTLLVNGSTAAGSAVSVISGATIGGTGTNNGTLNVNSGATLAPGANAIGTFTVANTATLSGTTVMELNRASSPNADKLNRSGGSLAFGGSLTVTNIGGTPVSGDTFDLFDATSFSGAFTATNLPPGGATHWLTSQLGVNGTITFTNSAPVAGTLTYGVAQGGVITIAVANGAKSLATDADGDALTVSNIGATNAVDFGVAIISGGGASLTYTNTSGSAGSTDLFSYTVSDGVGGLATNSISIRIDPAQGANLVSATAGGGFAYLAYAGIPGTNYALDWATNITYPINWTLVQTKVAGGDGSLRFTNLLSSYPTNDFFRTRFVP